MPSALKQRGCFDAWATSPSSDYYQIIQRSDNEHCCDAEADDQPKSHKYMSAPEPKMRLPLNALISQEDPRVMHLSRGARVKQTPQLQPTKLVLNIPGNTPGRIASLVPHR
jgi:hypothetical protein